MTAASGPRLEWFACGEDLIPAGSAWLHPQEQRRLARYRFTKRRTEYCLRRVAGKYAVATRLGLDVSRPEALGRIGVLTAPGGAPYVVVDDAPCGLEVSLTDRAGHAVCLVGPEGAARSIGGIGVDVEIVEHRSQDFVRDFLTGREQRWLTGQLVGSPDAYAAGANLVWSAKEAALKVQRVGLRADTRSVDVSVLRGHHADGWARLTVDHRDGAYPGWWRRDGQFLLTVVTRHPCDPPAAMPGSGDLATARPTHSWLQAPTSGS
ncbi:MAG: 4'-phosphopantetheinyl transferase superfamily protein [Austwickia sp.]|nr:MAG: 4'-phosphopantetheinyl transferase superfamily protein [Austwickia sp.]